jgi:hypothetical protein
MARRSWPGRDPVGKLGSIQGMGAAHDFMPRLESEALEVLRIDPRIREGTSYLASSTACTDMPGETLSNGSVPE